MKVILIGGSGQLGQEISKNKPDDIKLLIPNRNELDLSNENQCYEYFSRNSAHWIINSGAFTNVDKAESNMELALKVNAYAPASIAKAISNNGGKFLQISTDYVFNGNQNVPYKTNQKPSPKNAYGISKSEGEKLLLEKLNKFNQLSILRTSWLMGPVGNNFAVNLLKLLCEKEKVNVVYDQISSPTTTLTLSQAVWKLIETNEKYTLNNQVFPKINHFADDGIASWYDVTEALLEIGIKIGLIKNKIKITPIRTDQFPTPAERPSYSVLDTYATKKILSLNGIHWRNSLLNTFKNFIDMKSNKTTKNG